VPGLTAQGIILGYSPNLQNWFSPVTFDSFRTLRITYLEPMAAGLRPDRVGQPLSARGFSSGSRPSHARLRRLPCSRFLLHLVRFKAHVASSGASLRRCLMTGPIAEAIRQAVLFFETGLVSLYTDYDSSRVKQWIHLAWSAGGCWFSCCGPLRAAMALGD
jgi:hypothetical protein